MCEVDWKVVAQTRLESLITVSAERDELSKRHSALLRMVKMCYRKHILGDDSIGWQQLEDTLLNALCNDMGDEEYQKWAEAAKENL